MPSALDFDLIVSLGYLWFLKGFMLRKQIISSQKITRLFLDSPGRQNLKHIKAPFDWLAKNSLVMGKKTIKNSLLRFCKTDAEGATDQLPFAYKISKLSENLL